MRVQFGRPMDARMSPVIMLGFPLSADGRKLGRRKTRAVSSPEDEDDNDMAYKMKPNKAALARFKFSKTGKVKRGHALTSHLMSARSSKTKRRLGRPAVMSETHAGNIRKMVGLQARNPN